MFAIAYLGGGRTLVGLQGNAYGLYELESL